MSWLQTISTIFLGIPLTNYLHYRPKVAHEHDFCTLREEDISRQAGPRRLPTCFSHKPARVLGVLEHGCVICSQLVPALALRYENIMGFPCLKMKLTCVRVETTMSRYDNAVMIQTFGNVSKETLRVRLLTPGRDSCSLPRVTAPCSTS